MFWDKNDTPSHNIEALLEKEDATVEDFLEEEDIIQECKTQKKSIVNYFTRPEVIKRMIELITTEPPEDLPMSERFRHANAACEILMLGIPSLDEKLIADVELLNLLYSYLENEPPLNPLLASFFSKTFSLLFTKKSDQDWFLYQQLCLKLLEFLKTKNNFLDLICKHFSVPVIPDVIMEMMRNVEGGQLRRSLYDWLNEERLVEKLLDIIGDPEHSEKHANVAEFLCDLIHQGRTMRQTDEDNDSFEPVFEGSNPILKNIESATTLFALFNVILQPNALESAIVSGITVVLKIIKPGMIIDEPNSTRLKFLQDREKEIHDELLSTVIRVIEPQLKHFNELIRNPPKKPDIVISSATLSPPFGMTRLQICRLFTVLLQTKNEEISKAICETDFLDILLSLLKQYCWNNFLHSEVEKCFQTIFYTELSNNNNSTYVSSASQYKHNNFGDNVFVNTPLMAADAGKKADATPTEASPAADSDDISKNTTAEQLDTSRGENSGDGCEGDVTKAPACIEPSAIQTHVIANCKVVSKLLECWQINRKIESAKTGGRLGYMGHLIKIFKHITNCISESEHIGALIESNLKDDEERELWQSIVNPTDGELTKALNTQSRLLANCEACDYDISSLSFLAQEACSDVFNNMCGFTDSKVAFGSNNDDEEDEDEENAAAGVTPHNNALTKSVRDSCYEFFALFTDATVTDDWFCPNFDTTSEEYDNNANVERYCWSSNVESPFQLKKDNTTTNFTKHNFVDYYEDDEGMWTKPLGGKSATIEDDDGQAQDACSSAFNNGPTNSQLGLEEEANTIMMESTTTNQLNKLLGEENDAALEDEFDTISSRGGETYVNPETEIINNTISKADDESSIITTPNKHNSITIDDAFTDNSAEVHTEVVADNAAEITTTTSTATINATTTDDSTLTTTATTTTTTT